MSDKEEGSQQGEEEAQEQAQPEEVQELDIHQVIKEVIKKSLFADGLSRGLHEAAKVLDAGKGQVCFLAEDCNEAAYKKLVQSLCREHDVPVLMIPTKVDLGEMVGLCRYDAEGKPKKVCACSCAVIKNYGEESEALAKLQSHIDEQKKK